MTSIATPTSTDRRIHGKRPSLLSSPSENNRRLQNGSSSSMDQVGTVDPLLEQITEMKLAAAAKAKNSAVFKSFRSSVRDLSRTKSMRQRSRTRSSSRTRGRGTATPAANIASIAVVTPEDDHHNRRDEKESLILDTDHSLETSFLSVDDQQVQKQHTQRHYQTNRQHKSSVSYSRRKIQHNSRHRRSSSCGNESYNSDCESHTSHRSTASRSPLRSRSYSMNSSKHSPGNTAKSPGSSIGGGIGRGLLLRKTAGSIRRLSQKLASGTGSTELGGDSGSHTDDEHSFANSSLTSPDGYHSRNPSSLPGDHSVHTHNTAVTGNEMMTASQETWPSPTRRFHNTNSSINNNSNISTPMHHIISSHHDIDSSGSTAYGNEYYSPSTAATGSENDENNNNFSNDKNISSPYSDNSYNINSIPRTPSHTKSTLYKNNTPQQHQLSNHQPDAMQKQQPEVDKGEEVHYFYSQNSVGLHQHKRFPSSDGSAFASPTNQRTSKSERIAKQQHASSDHFKTKSLFESISPPHHYKQERQLDQYTNRLFTNYPATSSSTADGDDDRNIYRTSSNSSNNPYHQDYGPTNKQRLHIKSPAQHRRTSSSHTNNVSLSSSSFGYTHSQASGYISSPDTKATIHSLREYNNTNNNNSDEDGPSTIRNEYDHGDALHTVSRYTPTTIEKPRYYPNDTNAEISDHDDDDERFIDDHQHVNNQDHITFRDGDYDSADTGRRHRRGNSVTNSGTTQAISNTHTKILHSNANRNNNNKNCHGNNGKLLSAPTSPTLPKTTHTNSDGDKETLTVRNSTGEHVGTVIRGLDNSNGDEETLIVRNSTGEHVGTVSRGLNNSNHSRGRRSGSNRVGRGIMGRGSFPPGRQKQQPDNEQQQQMLYHPMSRIGAIESLGSQSPSQEPLTSNSGQSKQHRRGLSNSSPNSTTNTATTTTRNINEFLSTPSTMNIFKPRKHRTSHGGIHTNNSGISASDASAATPVAASSSYAATRDGVSKYSGHGLVSGAMPVRLARSYSGGGDNRDAMMHNNNYDYSGALEDQGHNKEDDSDSGSSCSSKSSGIQTSLMQLNTNTANSTNDKNANGHATHNHYGNGSGAADHGSQFITSPSLVNMENNNSKMATTSGSYFQKPYISTGGSDKRHHRRTNSGSSMLSAIGRRTGLAPFSKRRNQHHQQNGTDESQSPTYHDNNTDTTPAPYVPPLPKISTILARMKAMPQNPGVQAWGAIALATSYSSPHTKAKHKDSLLLSSVHTILSALTVLIEDIEVVKEGMDALLMLTTKHQHHLSPHNSHYNNNNNYARDDDSEPLVQIEACSAIAMQGGIPILLSTLTQHPLTQHLQQTGLCLLRQLLRASPGNNRMKAALTSSFGIEITIKAIFTHGITSSNNADSGYYRILEDGCMLLWSLGFQHSDNLQRIHVGGGAGAILAGMESAMQEQEEDKEEREINNKRNERVQGNALGALHTLSFHPGIRSGLRDNGGMECVLKAMSLHPHSASVQERACGALATLVVRDEQMSNSSSGDVVVMLLDGQAMVMIAVAMENHITVARVQRNACLLLWLLCKSLENVRIMQQKTNGRIRRVLIGAIQQFPSECEKSARFVIERMGSIYD